MEIISRMRKGQNVNAESMFIITTAAGHEREAKKELTKLLSGSVITTLFMKGNIYVECPQKEDEVLNILRNNPTIYVGKIFPIEKKVKIPLDRDGIKTLYSHVSQLNKLKAGETFIVDCTRRGIHQFHSHDVERELGTYLENETGATVDFENPEKTVVIQIFQNIAFIGVTKTENILKKTIKVFRKYPKGERPLNRAMLKIREALDAFSIEIQPSFEILDIGAAPGGWTKVLSSSAKKVVAVDPAALDPSVTNLPNIAHLQCRAEEVPENIGLFDMITNDMNLDPVESSKIMVNLADHLRNGGIAIMTIKFITKNRRKHVEEAIKILGDRYGVFQIKRLPHNRYETTVFMKKI